MRTLLDRCTTQLQHAVVEFPWTDRQAYGDWLAQTYYYVRHSTRLLAAASARFGLDARGDALHYRFAAHISEEKRHEQLALHDLKRLGFSLEDFSERHSTRLFYEPQYFKIEHEAPSALFGYILPLEVVGPAVGKDLCAKLVAAFGPKCETFFRVHAEEDGDHVEKAMRLIDTVPENERPYLLRNIEQSVYAYCAMLQDILAAPAGAARSGT